MLISLEKDFIDFVLLLNIFSSFARKSTDEQDDLVIFTYSLDLLGEEIKKCYPNFRTEKINMNDLVFYMYVLV